MLQCRGDKACHLHKGSDVARQEAGIADDIIAILPVAEVSVAEIGARDHDIIIEHKCLQMADAKHLIHPCWQQPASKYASGGQYNFPWKEDTVLMLQGAF